MIMILSVIVTLSFLVAFSKEKAMSIVLRLIVNLALKVMMVTVMEKEHMAILKQVELYYSVAVVIRVIKRRQNNKNHHYWTG
jgi:hypothetical protein